MKIPKDVLELMQDRVEISVRDAATLPGFLGRIVPVMLARHGWYAATVDGVRRLYVLA